MYGILFGGGGVAKKFLTLWNRASCFFQQLFYCKSSFGCMLTYLLHCRCPLFFNIVQFHEMMIPNQNEQWWNKHESFYAFQKMYIFNMKYRKNWLDQVKKSLRKTNNHFKLDCSKSYWAQSMWFNCENSAPLIRLNTCLNIMAQSAYWIFFFIYFWLLQIKLVLGGTRNCIRAFVCLFFYPSVRLSVRCSARVNKFEKAHFRPCPPNSNCYGCVSGFVFFSIMFFPLCVSIGWGIISS